MDKKEDIYFVHGFYYESERDYLRKIDQENTFQGKQPYAERIKPNHIILIKDSIDDESAVRSLDVDVRDVEMDDRIIQGVYVYYNENRIASAENDPAVVVYKELNDAITQFLRLENENNEPNVDNYDNVADIFDEYGTNKISKLLVTHFHYDHISGIEYLIRKGNIDCNTEVWMNLYYPWTQATYTRTLAKLKKLGVRFIDPVVGNSTRGICILYPKRSFSATNPAPKNEINNSSILYQIILAGKSMLFTGDIETDGWDNVDTCYPYMNKSDYYCISHHGSINGHYRNKCGCVGARWRSSDVWRCAKNSKVQILMGRDKAFNGIYSQQVLNSFGKHGNLHKTENAPHYIKLDWKTGYSEYK